MKIMPKSNKVDNFLKEPVVFYCKDCDKIVKVRPFGRKFVYKCAICNTKNVAFGTEKAIRNYYRIEENEKKEKAKERAKENEKKLELNKQDKAEQKKEENTDEKK